MQRRILSRSFEQVFPKVIKAFLGWGMGMIIMFIFSIFVLLLKRLTNVYIMSIGAILFLVIGYILIDLWWNYRNLAHSEKLAKTKLL